MLTIVETFLSYRGTQEEDKKYNTIGSMSPAVFVIKKVDLQINRWRFIHIPHKGSVPKHAEFQIFYQIIMIRHY